MVGDDIRQREVFEMRRQKLLSVFRKTLESDRLFTAVGMGRGKTEERKEGQKDQMLYFFHNSNF